jgi:transposase
MKLHANAALSLRQRERMACRVVELGWSLTKAAAAAEVSERTCSKWVRRYRADGLAGLVDRSSAPGVVANRTEEQTVQVIAALRRLRFTGPEIAELLDRPLSTVSGILTRIGMGKLGRLGLEPANRYERQRPGELIPRRRQNARANRWRRRQTRPRRRQPLHRLLHRRDRHPARQGRLGMRAHRDR